MEKVRGLFQSRRFHITLGVVISLILIGYFVSIVEWPEVIAACRDINYWYFIPVTLLFLLQNALRAFRWKYLLPPVPHITFGQLFDGTMIGTFGNFVLPLRAGEFLRPLLLKKVTGAGFTTSFVSVIVERILDLAAVLIVFALLLRYVDTVPPWVDTAAIFLGIVAVLLCSGVIVAALFPRVVFAISEFCIPFLPELFARLGRKLTRDILAGTRVLKDPLYLAGALIGTAAVWFCTFVQMYYSFSIFNIDAEFWHAITISIIIGLAIAAPSAPGFVGVFQLACLASFSICGLDEAKGAAFALVIHLHQYIIIVSLGVLISLKHGVRLSDLSRQSREASEASLEAAA